MCFWRIANCPKRKLVLVGDGSERSNSITRPTVGLVERVHFRGEVSHLVAMQSIAESRLVVIPSRQEAFGIIAVEAMALGKPVVATHVGGLPEDSRGRGRTVGRARRPPGYVRGHRKHLKL